LQIVLTLISSGQPLTRNLLADTGAGSQSCGFELILEEDDCLLCGGLMGASVTLGGAYVIVMRLVLQKKKEENGKEDSGAQLDSHVVT
jgi:hypothetical protein